jgi:hypothetical protein
MGFVEGGGCDKAIFAVRSVVNYFLKHDSPVFICSLDAEKAFDRVNHYGLLSVLIDRGLPKHLILLLHKWFSSMSFSVLWGNNMSSLHSVLSGLLQGNLLSPKFFSVYVDSLLCKLELCNEGCKLFRQFLGAIMYADDLLLMSSSILCLQSMINVCLQFGVKMGITFGHAKSKGLAIYPGCVNRVPVSSLSINGIDLPWVAKLRYLGVFITNNSKNVFDITEQIRKFYGSVHSILSHTDTNNELVVLEILKKQCSPILFYGLNAICISNSMRDMVSKAWNFGIRKVFNINKRESTRLLFYYCNLMSASFTIDCMQMSLYATICDSNLANPMLTVCSLALRYDESFRNICYKNDVPLNVSKGQVKRIMWDRFVTYCFD